MKLTGKNYLKINQNDGENRTTGISQNELENFFVEYLAKKYGENKLGLILVLKEGKMYTSLYHIEKNEDVIGKMLIDYEREIKKHVGKKYDDFLYSCDLEESLVQILLEEHFSRKIEEIVEGSSCDFESSFYVIFE